MNLIELIPEGKENAVTKARLTEITGLTDRVVRLTVAQERKRGKVILSDCSGAGYYRPSNHSDSFRFVKSMRHRAKEINEAADAVERAVLKEIGQEQMEGWQ